LAELKIERRLAAIMATDVVGYSRLMGRDERGTLRVLNAHRAQLIDPAIAAHGGRIVKTMGDGLLIEFASVVNAITCAVAVQRGMQIRNAETPDDAQMLLRVGINVGDIIIEGRDIFGDGVNVAARLEAISTAGGMCISDVAYQQVRDKLALDFVDIGPQTVKNMARPIQAYALDAGAIRAAPDLAPPEGNGPPRRRIAIIAASIAFLMIVAGAAAWVFVAARFNHVADSSSLIRSDRQQIAVLPLRTIGGGDEYFADGLTEDLIAALGRFRDLSVRSHSAVVVYKDQTAPPADIGRALEVRYILEGSVRRAADHIRADIRLTDAAVGAVLWSETYDADAKDVLAVQDDITHRVAGSLAVRLNTLAVANAAAKPVANLEAYDLVQRGRERMVRLSRSANSDARALFERAVTLDPEYAPAYVGLGRTDINLLEMGWTQDPQGALARALSRGQKAVALQPDSPTAHALLGRAFIRAGDYDAALAELRRAVALNPSDAEALAALGDVLVFNGDSSGAISALEDAARFRPVRPANEYFSLGLAYILAGRTTDAVQILEQSNSVNGPSDRRFTAAILAAAYALLGRTEDAVQTANAVREIDPTFDSEVFGSLLRRPEDRETIRNALRRASL
jgi:adenylate cyclase